MNFFMIRSFVGVVGGAAELRIGCQPRSGLPSRARCEGVEMGGPLNHTNLPENRTVELVEFRGRARFQKPHPMRT
jgi:hypothetical protein